jgi:hypothetical protein
MANKAWICTVMLLLVLCGVQFPLARAASDTNRQPLWSLTLTGTARVVAVNDEGTKLFVGDGKNVNLFYPGSNTILRTFETDASIIELLACSGSGNYMLALSRDGNGALFSSTSSTPLWTLSSPTHTNIEAIALSQDGSVIAISTSDPDNLGSLVLYTPSSSTPVWTYRTQHNNDFITDLSMTPDGSKIAITCDDLNMSIFSKNSGIPVRQFPSDAYMDSISISADGNLVSVITRGVTDRDEHYLRLYDNRSAGTEPVYQVKMDYIEATDTTGMTLISADGSYIYAFARAQPQNQTGANLTCFGNMNNSPLWSVVPFGLDGSDIALSPDGMFLIVASWNGHLNAYYARNGTIAWTYIDPTNNDYADVAISRNANVVAAVDRSNKLSCFARTPLLMKADNPSEVLHDQTVNVSLEITSDGHAVPNATVRVNASVGNTSTASILTDPEGKVVFNYTAPDPITTKQVTITVTISAAGYLTAEDQIIMDLNGTIPNVAPSVVITSPAAGSTVSGLLAITGTANDSDGNLDIVEIRIANGSWQKVSGNSSWNFTLDTKTLANGNLDIQARAVDKRSENSTIATITVNIDNKAASDGSPGFGIALTGACLIALCAVVATLRRRN